MNPHLLDRRRLCFAAPLLVVAFLSSSAAWGQEMTLRLNVGGTWLEGGPAAWSDQRVFLFGRDGSLADFAPDEATEFQKTADRFQPLTHSELRGELLREFGKRFEVSGGGSYVVVHPVGERDRWANRFDELYRSFLRYFSVRGIDTQPSQFPLIAVVFKTQDEFYQYARQIGDNIGPNVLGYYSVRSNRILLFDVTGGQSTGTNWSENDATIIHEAAHQSAFNTGIHSRVAPPPRWVVEGLGTMFEAPGVWNSRLHPDLEDRVNRGRLAGFRRYVPKRHAGSLIEFVSSDRPFQADADAAYSEAWLLTMYLVEREPQRYRRYLTLLAGRSPFEEYSAPDRLRDFASIFGKDLPMLETRMLRFAEELK